MGRPPNERTTATTEFEAKVVELIRRTTIPAGFGASEVPVSDPDRSRPVIWALPEICALPAARVEAETVPVKFGLLFNCAKLLAGKPPSVAALTLANPVPSPVKLFPGLLSVTALT